MNTRFGFIKKCICLALVVLITGIVFLNTLYFEPIFQKVYSDEIYTSTIASFEKTDIRQTRLFDVCLSENDDVEKTYFSFCVIFLAKTLAIVFFISIIVEFIHSKDGLKRKNAI